MCGKSHCDLAFNKTIKIIRGASGAAPGGVHGAEPLVWGLMSPLLPLRVKFVVERGDLYSEFVIFLRRLNPLKIAPKSSKNLSQRLKKRLGGLFLRLGRLLLSMLEAKARPG